MSNNVTKILSYISYEKLSIGFFIGFIFGYLFKKAIKIISIIIIFLIIIIFVAQFYGIIHIDNNILNNSDKIVVFIKRVILFIKDYLSHIESVGGISAGFLLGLKVG